MTLFEVSLCAAVMVHSCETTSSASNKLAGHIITSLLITENTVCIQDSFRPVFAARHEEAPQHGMMMNACSFDNRVRGSTSCVRVYFALWHIAVV